MKCAIFCLLAFCALKLVFAVLTLPEAFARVRKASLDAIDGIDRKLEADIQAVLRAEKAGRIFYDYVGVIECREPRRKFNSYCLKGYRNCQKRHERYRAAGDFTLATTCCNTIIADLESKAPEVYQTVTECIRNVFDNEASGSGGHHAGPSNSRYSS